ncbi:insulin-degrading enzyme-like isoform X1 [Condylostylus longicornis]|uniref:insulin-degrading enzyme-like isoform X1 n=2 Tax=Condylostylus longicornis TaxID=2530218 RepID=UPI00244E4B95|nr:insulin-degrading enzyme-like isoform X1 [Condylostylus longicornis]
MQTVVLRLKYIGLLYFNNTFKRNFVSQKQFLKKGSKMIRIDNIIKSESDKRDYRGLIMENKMKVLLVSDPSTDISSAALAVEVGHMSDPDHIPGLAHMCEHMLFLGTEKYPNENSYSSFLSQNGGNSNAATYHNLTKYYFTVKPDQLEGALDRFAQFFICPLFTESATDREINAVNSEHEKNLSIDSWRIRQVNKSLAIESHPYSKFGSGNESTLKTIPKQKNIDVRSELIKFHDKWYSSDIMCLSVLGKETLDELEEMVITKFSDVKEKNVEPPRWSDKPYDDSQFSTKVEIIPVKDIRALTLSFMTKDLDEYYKSPPENYISHLIGHEGKGSILSELKKQGWCNDLTAGHSNISRGFGFFEISVDLTEEGFNNVDQIVHLIFQYIKLLKEEGPKKWIFDEYRSINEMLFKFKEKDSPTNLVSNVVHLMQIYPLEEVLSAPYLLSEWKPELITEILECLKPENCRITVLGQKLKNCNESEYWYKTKYSVTKIPLEILKKWENCPLNENLALPEPNPFVPTDFTLVALENDLAKHPSIVHDTSYIRAWHKQDADFLKPKTFINFSFSNPIVYFDPLNCNLTHLLVQLFKDALNEYTYDAELAGLKFDVEYSTSGISVNIYGYSHKINILLQKVLDQLFSFEINEKRFDIFKEDYTRQLKNFKAEQPYKHAIYYLALILTENAWSKGELLDAMTLTTYENLKQYTKDFFSRLHTEIFVYGNVNKQQTLKIVDLCVEKLEKTNSKILPILARQLLQKREYKLNDGDCYAFQTDNEYHHSSCTQLYLQCNSQTNSTTAFIDLVAQILTEPCYNCLRTEEQLGYIVFCGSRKANSVTSIRIIVQSSKPPYFVEERIENFLNNMLKTLEEMPKEEFERYKNALITLKLEKPKKMNTQFYKDLNEITLAQYHFERDQAECEIIKKISKEEIISFYKTYILKSSSKRRSLSIHIMSTVKKSDDAEQPMENGVLSDNYQLITDLSAFKSSKELYPVTRPYLDVNPKGAKSKL